MNTLGDKIVSSVNSKFTTPLLPAVEFISCANTPAKKMIVKYFWEDYAPFTIIILLTFLVGRTIVSCFPSSELLTIYMGSVIFLDIFVDGFWSIRLSTRFTNKTKYNYSAFFSLPISAAKLIRQQLKTHYLISGITHLFLLSLYIGQINLNQVIFIFSIKIILMLILACFLIDHWTKWPLILLGAPLLGISPMFGNAPYMLSYQIPFTVIYAFIIYVTIIYSININRTSELTSNSLFVSGDSFLSSKDKPFSRKNKSSFYLSLFRRGNSSNVMLSRLVYLSCRDSSILTYRFLFLLLIFLLSDLPFYLFSLYVVVGSIMVLLNWLANRICLSSTNFPEIISILPLSNEQLGNQLSRINVITRNLSFLFVFPLLCIYSVKYFPHYESMLFIAVIWIIPLLEIKDSAYRSIYGYLKLSNNYMRILTWIGYILAPCVALTLYYGDMIPFLIKTALIIILLFLSLILLTAKAHTLIMIGKGYGVFGKRTHTLFYFMTLIIGLVPFCLLSYFITANGLSGILKLPISLSSTILINLTLSITWGISESLTVFIDPIRIYLWRHQ